MSNQVLLIEDDIAFATMLTSFLQRNNFVVTVAHTGEEGRKVLGNTAYNVLITDLKLPDTSGIEILEYCIYINRIDSKSVIQKLSHRHHPLKRYPKHINFL